MGNPPNCCCDCDPPKSMESVTLATSAERATAGERFRGKSMEGKIRVGDRSAREVGVRDALVTVGLAMGL